MLEGVKQQYDWIRSARQVLFAFLEEIPLQKLHEAVPGFGIDTIIGAHIHAADSYRFWLGSFAFKHKPSDFRETANHEITCSDVKDVRVRFDHVDEIVQKFMVEYSDGWFDDIQHEVAWQDQPWVVTPLRLLTHVETHEFHHKGQILSMARHLGFAPENDWMGGLFS